MKNFSFPGQTTRTKIMWAAALVVATGVIGLLFARYGIELFYFIVPVFALAACGYGIHLDRLRQKTGEIVEASRLHLATVEALATAIDARDQVGVGHVRRTQIYAVGMGKLLGLPSKDIDAIRTGALLHDIGKLAVPDHILNKPDGLTPAEFEKTKIHSRVGASILEKVDFDCPVVATVKYHHENWDGTGYPEGLRGESIPLTARILGLAAAFDTVRTARPYRAAMTREQARQTILSEAGTRFDPTVVDTLLRNLAQLEAQINSEGLSYDEPASSSQNYVEQIKLANREVFSLYEMAREFSSSESLHETLDMFARKIAEFVPFNTSVIYLLDHAKRNAVAAYVAGDHAGLLESRRLKAGQGATGFALKTRQTVHNVDPDLDFSHSQAELSGHYSTMASVPLLDNDELIGAITIYARDLDKYGEEHIRLLETVSRIAADAIGKSLKHDEARTHALTDPMTGLPNARNLQMQFEKEVARAKRGDNGFQLLMLDLDGFKAVNDSFGHKAGDEMLKGIGKVIADQLRDYDFLARYGGDEFVALIPDTSPEDVLDLCNRIENAVTEFALPVGDGQTASVGVSLGAAGYPKNGETFDQMVVAADRIMYERKTRRKRSAAAASGIIDQNTTLLVPAAADKYHPFNDSLIVELDETHVVASTAIN
jgi:diguanylate cyclase (GGDEF)-like protein/putative nucleotidyltransferase with HDIG domain